MTLGPERHDRDAAGLTYVYPVVSRRSAGLSLGVNLNPNNACNWRCVYCQVPGLVRGKAPPIDLALLAAELRSMLAAIVRGDYLERHVPAGSRRLADVAISGNGEATTSPQFEPAVEVVRAALEEFGLLGGIKLVLITNGSMLRRAGVRRALARLSEANGEIWFKLDSATDEGLRRINSSTAGMGHVARCLELACALCPTWIQTCVFGWKGAPPSELEQQALIDFLRGRLRAGLAPRGVLLYGLARPSCQPEAAELGRLPAAWLEAFAGRLRETGLAVRVFP